MERRVTGKILGPSCIKSLLFMMESFGVRECSVVEKGPNGVLGLTLTHPLGKSMKFKSGAHA